MYVGVDFYPEHWPRKLWNRYASLMRKANFNIVRLAEFAWVLMEPQEGCFDFAWLDEALAILGKGGISVILGTPTAVMPAWVARKYPDCLATQKNGQRIEWGVRKNNCFSSPTYRLLSQRITRAMAEHFAAAPNVIGWQSDNEFGDPVCYCDTCREGFHDWLVNKYKTLEKLNAAWGTHFWGQRFGQWCEIPLPIDPDGANPSLYLDWRRYGSWLNVRFQGEQVRILRECCPRHFITHNFMGLYSELNYYDLAEDLDFVSWDNYPIGGPPGILYNSAAAADLMRGLKRRNFWIMEQTAGASGWGCFNRNPRPGEIRLVAWQQMAHGADAQLWFRWRTCTAGREQYWHGLLGHDGKPLRRYREAARVGAEFKKLARHVEGTTVHAPVAMIYDYESHWALTSQPGYAGHHYYEAILRYYRALFRAGVNVDMVKPGGNLAGYRIVIAPDLFILPDDLAKQLCSFVFGGGVLLADCRTGVKDENSLCHARTLPGLLSKALGVVIEEYEAVPDGAEYAVSGVGDIVGDFTATRCCDWVKPRGAQRLAVYQPWHLKDFAAATRYRYGKGTGFYVGTVIRQEEFYDALIACLLQTGRVRPVVKPPAGVEVSLRQGRGGKLLFVMNHTEETKIVHVPPGKGDLLRGTRTAKTLRLARYDVALLKL